jgi:SRSO17 transposase
LDEKIELVADHADEPGLNRCLEALGVSKGTWHYRMRGGSKAAERAARDEALREPLVDIIRDHPAYGYRRIRPELEERTGGIVNDKRFRRLLGKFDLSLHRIVSRPKPSPVRRLISEGRAHLSLVRDTDPGVLEPLSTDFTELRYGGGGRKAWLTGFVDLESSWMAGWAVGRSPNRTLGLTAWQRTREAFSGLGEDVAGTVVHQDQDAVFTSYAWLRALLLDAGARVSCSENGAKGNPQDPSPSGPGSSRRISPCSSTPGPWTNSKPSWRSRCSTTIASGAIPTSATSLRSPTCRRRESPPDRCTSSHLRRVEFSGAYPSRSRPPAISEAHQRPNQLPDGGVAVNLAAFYYYRLRFFWWHVQRSGRLPLWPPRPLGMAIPKAGPMTMTDLARFLEPFGELLRRSESRETMERYVTGLLSDVSRKTASEMGRSLPGANGQRLREFLTNTAWKFREMDGLRIAYMLAHASVGDGLLVSDDTGLPKKGRHSVGVARQYSGTLGGVDNCQTVVTAHYVDRVFDWPVNCRLYLPQSWSRDAKRCTRARVPEAVSFRTKGRIALQLLDEALEAGIVPRAAVPDTGYGDQRPFLEGPEARDVPYVVAVESKARFRLVEAVEADPGDGAPPPYQGRGRPRKASTLEERVSECPARELLASLPADAWRRVAWPKGAKGALVKGAVRVRVLRTGKRGKRFPRAGWLVGERPLSGHPDDSKYYFARNLDERSLEDLIELARGWVIERFYQDAKGELGLDDYEGRLRPGPHRHLALVRLTHSFLTLRQSYGAETMQRAPPPRDTPPDGRPAPPARNFPPCRSEERRRSPTSRV